MFRECTRPQCTHYALHVVSAADGEPKVPVCHLDVAWAICQVFIKVGTSRTRISVATSSEVVIGDVLAWRTRGITAYEEFRQIKGV
jgi:hypothetical protein